MLKPRCAQRFPRSERLLESTDFKTVFDGRHLRRGRFFALHWKVRSSLQAEVQPTKLSHRLGVVIPKKLIKTAAHRNLLKRLCREVFRQMQDRSDEVPRLDMVLRLSAKLEPSILALTRKEIATDIAGLLAGLTKPAASQ